MNLYSNLIYFFFFLFFLHVFAIDPEEREYLREEVKRMFYHGYDNYMKFAFPLDELKPISCSGYDTLGGYTLTLVDTLDTLIVLGNYTEFRKGVEWVRENLSFDKDKPVSVFETNIRMMGGLLSAHFLASDEKLVHLINEETFESGLWSQPFEYHDELLNLAFDLGDRLLPAFNTPSGIPYGTVNLKHGVPKGETTITSTAGGGTFALEFGILSRLSGDLSYEWVARNAIRGLWSRRSALGLVGSHIDISTGVWTHKDSGIGAGADSFFEYLLKAAILFSDSEYLDIFNEAYRSVLTHVYKDPWYVDVHMTKAQVLWPLFSTLHGFWPGVQVMYGDIEKASATQQAFQSVWQKYGFTPEGFNLISGLVQKGQKGYPLRPELAESLYTLYLATKDPIWFRFGRDIVVSLQNIARVECGFAAIEDVETHELRDHMDSFFLAETCKYLYLLFDENNFVNRKSYVFNTEGHFFPVQYESMRSWPSSLTGFWPIEKKCPKIPYWKLISADEFQIHSTSTQTIPSTTTSTTISSSSKDQSTETSSNKPTIKAKPKNNEYHKSTPDNTNTPLPQESSSSERISQSEALLEPKNGQGLKDSPQENDSNL